MSPPNKPYIWPRGVCAYCRRDVALLRDGFIALDHLDRQGKPCIGRGSRPLPEPDRDGAR